MSHIKLIQDEQDAKTEKAILETFQSNDDISIPIIQRKCHVGYNSAYRTFTKLVSKGLIKQSENQKGISKFI